MNAKIGPKYFKECLLASNSVTTALPLHIALHTSSTLLITVGEMINGERSGETQTVALIMHGEVAVIGKHSRSGLDLHSAIDDD